MCNSQFGQLEFAGIPCKYCAERKVQKELLDLPNDLMFRLKYTFV